MKQGLQLRLGQQLTMTPQLQQAIRLLQLSTLELNLEVQEALESNMMLELAEDAEELDAERLGGEEPVAAGDAKGEVGELTGDAVGAEGGESLPDDLPVDTAWDDVYDATPVASVTPTAGATAYDMTAHQASEGGLHEHLLWQLNLTPMSERDRVIAMTIVDAIDGDGFLRAGLEEVRAGLTAEDQMDVETGEVQAVLAVVQSLDPPGVGARDLRECLLLQLGQLEPDTPWLAEANSLVANHLELLGARDYGQLLRRTRLAQEELQKVVRLIQSLNPKPGAHLEPADVEYVVPDVYVRKQGDTWVVELNPDTIPHLRVNQSYADMIRRADNSADNNSLKSHLQEARWLIKSLQSRSETLLRVATAIVHRQQAFFEHGEEAMKPLVLHDIADELGMHESTISRVTTRKYMHTPRGILELKYFFSSHVSTDVGGEASSTAIRAVIKKLVAAENPAKPLSDSKIAGTLKEQGINVARRTVAKYREALHIPPSNERKRLV